MVAAPSATRLPRHVAVIMDGNGRWAEQRGLPRIEGHREGAKSVRAVVRAARQIGLEAITLYAFSAQNWGRPASEVTGLMELLRDYLIEERPEIMENGIRLRAIGDIERLPRFVLDPLDALVRDSAGHRVMSLTLALA
jgi:undecaprenyl diphosphate synthase